MGSAWLWKPRPFRARSRHKGYFGKQYPQRPSDLTLSFELGGEGAWKAFRDLLKNYRRTLERLLGTIPELEFQISVPIDRVDNYKGSDAFGKLDRLFRKYEEEEDSFDLLYSVNARSAQPGLLERVYVTFVALYDATCGYIMKEVRPDQIHDHFNRIVEHYGL